MQLKSSVRLAGISALAALAMVLCGFTPDNHLKTTLQTRYDAAKVAMAARDFSAWAATVTPDFVSQDPSGHSKTASQVIEDFKRVGPDPNQISTRTLDEIVRHGDTATVQTRGYMRTTKTGSDGRQHKIEMVIRSTDTWIKPEAGWLLQQSVINEVTYSVDGVVAMHKVRQ